MTKKKECIVIDIIIKYFFNVGCTLKSKKI